MLQMNDPKDIGKSLKKLRAVKGITLQEVSNATGISVSFLSLVENSKSGISLSNLQKILKLYDTSINDLVDTSGPESIVKSQDDRVVRSEEAKIIHSETDGIHVVSLVRDSQNKKIWPGLFTMDPGATIGPFEHDGEEFSHVIQGKVQVTLINTQTGEKEIHIITEGDTIYHPSTYTHTYFNISKQKSIFLAAVTPPSF